MASQCISLAFVSMVFKIDVAWLARRGHFCVSVVLKIEPTLYISIAFTDRWTTFVY